MGPRLTLSIQIFALSTVGAAGLNCDTYQLEAPIAIKRITPIAIRFIHRNLT
jgi:hypothetical protein